MNLTDLPWNGAQAAYKWTSVYEQTEDRLYMQTYYRSNGDLRDRISQNAADAGVGYELRGFMTIAWLRMVLR